MRTLRDFSCECGKTYERFVSHDITTMDCDCGKKAIRIVGMPTVMLDGTDPAFPGAWDKWARIREDRHKQQSKRG